MNFKLNSFPPSLRPCLSSMYAPPSSEPISTQETTNGGRVNEGTAIPAASFSDYPNPSEGDPPPEENPEKIVNKQKKKTKKRLPNHKDNSVTQSSLSSSSSSASPSHRGTRVASKRRNPRVVFGPARRNPIADAIAFRLGMSIAAFVSQVFFFLIFF